MCFIQRENESHRRNLKGGAFRLNMHAKSYFDENPYKSDKALPGPKKSAGRRIDLKPFKPSSPGKLVSKVILQHDHISYSNVLLWYIHRT